jgi:hypothetical protein
MKNYIIILLIFLFLLPGIGFAGSKDKKFRVELYGGLSALNPADLNARPGYTQAYEDFNYLDSYISDAARLGELFRFTYEMTGELKKIPNARQVGGRVTYNLSSGWGLSLGFRFLEQSRSSEVSYYYEAEGVRPDSVFLSADFERTREYGPYALSAKGYAPLLGVHYCWFGRSLGSRVSMESYLEAGPLFASCRFEERLRSRYEDSSGYWESRETFYAIEGSGVGVSIEAGIRINMKLYRAVGFFIEGGYTLQKVRDVSGQGIYERTYDDSNAEVNTTAVTWDGTWVMVPASFDTSIRYPASEYSEGQYEKFILDLSGFQARVGISWKF